MRGVVWSPASKDTTTSPAGPNNATVRRPEFAKWSATDVPLMAGMNIVGDLGRYAKFQVAQSIPTAAANPGGGGAGVGAGLGAGMAMGQAMLDALKPDAPPGPKPCAKCGKPVPPQAKFCPECGAAQA